MSRGKVGIDQLESFFIYPGKRYWWTKVGAMRKEVVVLCIYSILSVQLIVFPGGLHVLGTER